MAGSKSKLNPVKYLTPPKSILSYQVWIWFPIHAQLRFQANLLYPLQILENLLTSNLNPFYLFKVSIYILSRLCSKEAQPIFFTYKFISTPLVPAHHLRVRQNIIQPTHITRQSRDHAKTMLASKSWGIKFSWNGEWQVVHHNNP